MLVPLRLDHRVQELALSINSAPEIDHVSVDLEIDIIQMPVVWGFGRRLRKSAAINSPIWFTQRRTVS
jgi:hypothetical protein